MTSENIKDIRLMLDMITKDLHRLADDVNCLGTCLEPLQKELTDVGNVRREGTLQARS